MKNRILVAIMVIAILVSVFPFSVKAEVQRDHLELDSSLVAIPESIVGEAIDEIQLEKSIKKAYNAKPLYQFAWHEKGHPAWLKLENNKLKGVPTQVSEATTAAVKVSGTEYVMVVTVGMVRPKTPQVNAVYDKGSDKVVFHGVRAGMLYNIGNGWTRAESVNMAYPWVELSGKTVSFKNTEKGIDSKVQNLPIMRKEISEARVTNPTPKVSAPTSPSNISQVPDGSNLKASKTSLPQIATSTDTKVTPKKEEVGNKGEEVKLEAGKENMSEHTVKFMDVSREVWYEKAVFYVNAKGLMKGVSAESFAPNAYASRGMLVTVLYRLAGEPMTDGKGFADVADDHYSADAVKWAMAQKIVDGYGDGKFGPNDAVSREQFLVLLRNYARQRGKEVDGIADISVFEDNNEVADYAKDAIAWANASGLIKGKDGQKLDPKGMVSRAEMAELLMRFAENILK